VIDCVQGYDTWQKLYCRCGRCSTTLVIQISHQTHYMMHEVILTQFTNKCRTNESAEPAMWADLFKGRHSCPSFLGALLYL
jgi:hypothetical protein